MKVAYFWLNKKGISVSPHDSPWSSSRLTTSFIKFRFIPFHHFIIINLASMLWYIHTINLIWKGSYMEDLIISEFNWLVRTSNVLFVNVVKVVYFFDLKKFFIILYFDLIIIKTITCIRLDSFNPNLLLIRFEIRSCYWYSIVIAKHAEEANFNAVFAEKSSFFINMSKYYVKWKSNLNIILLK